MPIRSLPYAISPKKLEGVRKEISSLLEKGIIVPSTSQWSSPIVPPIKPDGSIRLCVDFRKLNAIIQPDHYCMPLVEELIARVGEAKYLSKMDLSKGFYQVPLAEEDREKTAFVTTVESSNLLGCRSAYAMRRPRSSDWWTGSWVDWKPSQRIYRRYHHFFQRLQAKPRAHSGSNRTPSASRTDS